MATSVGFTTVLQTMKNSLGNPNAFMQSDKSAHKESFSLECKGAMYRNQ
jgi:hypothetical protein